MQQNAYPLRIDTEVMDKIRKIANDEGRSINKEIEFILRHYIKTYEDTHQ